MFIPSPPGRSHSGGHASPAIGSFLLLNLLAGADMQAQPLLPSAIGVIYMVAAEPTVETLWSGSHEERLEAASWAGYWFPSDASPAQVADLASALAAERDEFIRFTMVRSLAGMGQEVHRRLLRGALKESSVSIRWAALEYFTEVSDEEAIMTLERWWWNERRPWVMARLLRALGRQGSRVFVDEALQLVQGETTETALAAMDALTSLDPPDARTLPVLLRLAARGSGPMAQRAMQALGDWPEDAGALQLLLDLSGSRQPQVRCTAVTALTAFPDDEVRQRCANIATLAGESDLGIFLQQWLETEGEFASGAAAVASLHAAICGVPPVPAKPTRWIVPSEPWTTVRCRRQPGVPEDPRVDADRLDAEQIEIDAYYEDGGGLWAKVAWGCWVSGDILSHDPPAEHVQEGQHDDVEDSDAELHLEWDLPLDDLAAPSGRQLQDLGLLRVFDPEADVAGACLRAAYGSLEDVVHLVEAYRFDGSVLDELLAEALSELEDEVIADPILLRRLTAIQE